MYDSRYTIDKLAQELVALESMIHRERYPLPPFRYHAGTEALVAPAIDDNEWPIIEPGRYWGAVREAFTMRTTFEVPPGLAEPVALHLPVGEGITFFPHPEALTYVDGEPWITVDKYHQELYLPDRWRDGREHHLALHGWCSIREEQFLMGQPAVVRIDEPTRRFYVAASLALEVVTLLPESDPVRHRLLGALERAFFSLDQRTGAGESFYASIRTALPQLEEAIEQAGPPLPVDVVVTGHAHIDVAWLWELHQTRRKTIRSWSTVLHLMEADPDFRFTQSQPQLYAYLLEDRPDLFARVQAQVEAGKWEVTGGMWVEADCNLTGAESLARQFLLGHRFYREHFGEQATPILWLPDCFGFPWSLPQLAKQAGMEYFLTSKISWNERNRLPYDSFWWQGLDGSRILAHFITTPHPRSPNPRAQVTTYNGLLTASEILGTWQHYQQPEQSQELLTVFGFGDGGGGPTRGMLERARRMAHHPGLPRVRQAPAHAFFRQLADRHGETLPVWNGELYLEYHQGTYTSQALTKQSNRRSESRLHRAEFLAAWAAEVAAYAYPHETLTEAWELLCLNQFHDILPGSSIAAVHAESQEQFAGIQALAETVEQAALDHLLARIGGGGDLVIFNPTGFPRSEILFVPAALGIEAAANSQQVDGGFLIPVEDLPAYGYREVALDRLPPPGGQLSAGRRDQDTWLLENRRLLVEIDGRGDLIRLFDKIAGREVLAPGGRGNRLQAFTDRPAEYDAWNIDLHYEEQAWEPEPASSIAIIEEGPLRAGIEIRRRLLNSEITQRLYLNRDSARLDFDTEIDWQERQTLLKVAFPVDILSPVATYDIQWGNIERPTHRNTSWDAARFEVCAHKWVDLSEGDYGVSLLNDSKYGHDVQDNVIRLTLLKGPIYPDPEADLGPHHLRYSLLPHAGDWRNGTVEEAYALNHPLVACAAAPGEAASPPAPSFIQTANPNAIIETIKQAEDGRGIIVRLYENQRRRGRITLHTGKRLARVERCNLIEEAQATIPCQDETIEFYIRPYEIVTLRLIFA